jgi:glucosamine 6-phosphate synthetase-like amidotransferase/phosphosugar isomerase protein
MDKMTNKERRWIAGIKPPDEMLTMSMTAIFEKECREQPERLAQVLNAYDRDQSIQKELHQLRQLALSPGPVLFLGMGASYCSSIAASVWLQSCNRSSFFADAGEWLHYAPALLDQVAVSVLTTASGESARSSDGASGRRRLRSRGRHVGPRGREAEQARDVSTRGARRRRARARVRGGRRLVLVGHDGRGRARV